MSEIITTISSTGADYASIGQLVASMHSAYGIIKVPEHMILGVHGGSSFGITGGNIITIGAKDSWGSEDQSAYQLDLGGSTGTYIGIARMTQGQWHNHYEISDAFDGDDDLSVPDPLALRALDELGIKP